MAMAPPVLPVPREPEPPLGPTAVEVSVEQRAIGDMGGGGGHHVHRPPKKQRRRKKREEEDEKKKKKKPQEKFFKPWMRHCPGKSNDLIGCGFWCFVVFLLASITIWVVAYVLLEGWHACKREWCERLHCTKTVDYNSTAPCFRSSSLCFKNCNSPIMVAEDAYKQCSQDCPAQCSSSAATDCLESCDQGCVATADMAWATQRSAACLVASRCEGLLEEEEREIAACKESWDVPEECDDIGARRALVAFVGLLPCIALCCLGTFNEVWTVPWLGHDPKIWLPARFVNCAGVLLAIIAAVILWNLSTRLEVIFYAPGPMVGICLLYLFGGAAVSVARWLFNLPVPTDDDENGDDSDSDSDDDPEVVAAATAAAN